MWTLIALIPALVVGWLLVEFMIGWTRGDADFANVHFLLERPVDDWPHMPFALMNELADLVDLIHDGRVLPKALWLRLEANPHLHGAIRRQAATLPPVRRLTRR